MKDASPMILLADADPAVRAALQFSLELEGFAVETFDSGAELLESGEVARADCLLIDQRLDEDLALLARLRRESPAVPAVITATHPTRAVRERLLAAGAALIEKPFMDDSLVNLLRTLLHRPAQVS